MNQLLKTAPFDLHKLSLFHLVAKTGSFTQAAQQAGVTQSAITRQIQTMESSLGVQLFQRTTRKVCLSKAGLFLYQDSARLLGDVERTIRWLQEGFADAPKQIRLGVSRTIGLAYLPGYLHANLRQPSNVTIQVSCKASHEIMSGLESDEQDIGIISAGRSLPKTLRVTHRFDDAFTLIGSPEKAQECGSFKNARKIAPWLCAQKWISLDQTTETGSSLAAWAKTHHIRITPTTELDNFDWIINLVSLGMGVSFVPIRALALYNQKKSIRRIPLPFRFSRELMVVTRRNRTMPSHLTEFIGKILFRSSSDSKTTPVKRKLRQKI